MATKLNAYVGVKKRVEEINEKINTAVMFWKIYEGGKRGVGAYFVPLACDIRDDVLEMKGEVNALLRGLDKNSYRRDYYQAAFDKFDAFIEATR